MSRPSVARVCVELDLLKVHPIRIRLGVEGSTYFQPVFYENMPSYCSECKRLGHDLQWYQRLGGNPTLSNVAIDAAKKKTIDDAENPVTSTVPITKSRLQEVPDGEASLSLDVDAAALVAIAEPQLQDITAGEESLPNPTPSTIVVVDVSDDTLPRLQEKDAAVFVVPLNQPSDDHRSRDVAAATESSPGLQNIDGSLQQLNSAEAVAANKKFVAQHTFSGQIDIASSSDVAAAVDSPLVSNDTKRWCFIAGRSLRSVSPAAEEIPQNPAKSDSYRSYSNSVNSVPSTQLLPFDSVCLNLNGDNHNSLTSNPVDSVSREDEAKSNSPQSSNKEGISSTKISSNQKLNLEAPEFNISHQPPLLEVLLPITAPKTYFSKDDTEIGKNTETFNSSYLIEEINSEGGLNHASNGSDDGDFDMEYAMEQESFCSEVSAPIYHNHSKKVRAKKKVQVRWSARLNRNSFLP
ncbi:OLC1v1004566C1 [Oldenlandia corymbosa var. corymbosa]|uniref:OLC1v1004566C1 n=1 Tax=Oldenlandia corymbosa var. corymbosa TaxID=529605 RepID=A0AAV1DCM0_OLDCO|nr:OLC1v1004566C1 [Oldenlandia corymbosa var. corymbosa]